VLPCPFIELLAFQHQAREWLCVECSHAEFDVPSNHFGVWLVKAALATQGFCGLIPANFSSIFPDINAQAWDHFGAQRSALDGVGVGWWIQGPSAEE